MTDVFDWVLLVIWIDCDSLSSGIRLMAAILYHVTTKETDSDASWKQFQYGVLFKSLESTVLEMWR